MTSMTHFSSVSIIDVEQVVGMFQRKQTFYQIILKFQEAPTTLFDIISQLWSFLESHRTRKHFQQKINH